MDTFQAVYDNINISEELFVTELVIRDNSHHSEQNPVQPNDTLSER